MKMSATNSVLNETDEISTNKELLDGNQYIHTNNTNLIPRMDSGGLLDVATAAGLYLSGGSGVLPPPDQYPPEEILSAQDLTEEDRKLAAALVAVQFVQQQKQQQLLLNDATVSAASNASEVTHNSLPNIVNIGSNKIGTMDDNLVDTQLLFSHDNKSSMNSVAISQYACSLDNNRLSHIKLSNDNENAPGNNITILNQNSRKLQSHSRSKNSKRSINNKHHITGGTRTSSKYSLLPSTSSATSNFRESNDFDITIKSEDDELPDFSDDLDSDFHDDVIGTQTAKKSLPHKKRISRKLKTNPTKLLPAEKTTNLYPKCIKCTKCGEPVRNIKDFNKDLLSDDPLSHTNGSITFHCQICSQIFDSQLMFYEHLKTHYEPEAAIVEKQRSEAILQTESFKQLETIKQGSVMVTFPTFTLKCLECDKTFRRQKAFDLHMRDAHPKVNKMEMEEFSETEDLMEGIRVVVDGESCGNDNGVNVLTNGHQTHPDLDHIVSIRNSHSQQIITNSNVILSDSKVWYREDELHATEADLQELEAQQLKEQQIQLENSLTSYICHLCGSVFEQRIYLQQHMAECYLVLKQEAELLNSPSQVIGKLDTEEDDGDVKDLINKKYRKKKGHLICKICDRVFNHRNSLVYHLRSHSGERPHQCEQCGKSFFATSALKVHMRLHSGDKPYKCEFCGRYFRQWGDLKYHCISLHSNKRQYQCEYCGKDFARKYSLIVHRRIHTGEKNYECEYCKKTFRASSYLQNHRKIHTGEKPHPCEICGKPFRVRSDMKRHMNTHNRDRFNKGCSTNDIKTNLSSDSEQAEMGLESANNVTEDNNVPADNTKEKEEVNVPLIPKTEASVSVKTIDPLQTPKEEDLSTGTLYTVPGDPLTIKEGNNTVYVWPVYMS